jgi:hypothetical protein
MPENDWSYLPKVHIVRQCPKAPECHSLGEAKTPVKPPAA